MIEWKQPDIHNLSELRRAASDAGAMSSDLSATNIYLLRHKYQTLIAYTGGFLVRWYQTSADLSGRNGITFPAGRGDPEKAVQELIQDRTSRGLPVHFVFLTEQQKDWLASRWPELTFSSDPGNTDYLYTAQHLARLPGRTNHKKRNHVAGFKKDYPDCRFELCTTAADADALVETERRWLAEQDPSAVTNSMLLEQAEIQEVAAHWQELSVLGAVLRVNGEPAAMTIASCISPGVYDIHFEKSYGAYARSGGFAAINMMFAEYLYTACGAQWINREEDINIEGLRKAKQSYHPDMLLPKYDCILDMPAAREA